MTKDKMEFRFFSSICICLILGLSACKKDPDYEGAITQKSKVGEPLDEVKIPIALWNMFESHKTEVGHKTVPEKKEEPKKETAKEEHGGGGEEHGAGNAGGGEHGGTTEHGGGGGGGPQKDLGVPKEQIQMKVYLMESSKGILGGSNHEITVPKGGGEVDLATFVSGDKRGTFRLFLVPDIEVTSDDHAYLYYASKGKKRKIDGQTFGSGCNTYLELTKFYDTHMKRHGFEVNTTKQRFVSVLAGTYFFVVPKDGALNVSYVTLQDSRYPELQCSDESGAGNGEKK